MAKIFITVLNIGNEQFGTRPDKRIESNNLLSPQKEINLSVLVDCYRKAFIVAMEHGNVIGFARKNFKGSKNK